MIGIIGKLFSGLRKSVSEFFMSFRLLQVVVFMAVLYLPSLKIFHFLSNKSFTIED